MRDNPNKFRKYSQPIFLAAIGILFVLGLWNEKTMPIAALLIVAATIAYLLLSLYYWRCPYCGLSFPIRASDPFAYCPHCGQALPSAKD